MESLKTYWPLLLVAAFFLYRHLKVRKVIKMLPELKNRGAQFLDVRTEAEFLGGANPLALNIPLAELSQAINKLKKNVPIVVCCASGSRSAIAVRMIKSKGFEAYNAGSWSNTLR